MPRPLDKLPLVFILFIHDIYKLQNVRRLLVYINNVCSRIVNDGIKEKYEHVPAYFRQRC